MAAKADYTVNIDYGVSDDVVRKSLQESGSLLISLCVFAAHERHGHFA